MEYQNHFFFLLAASESISLQSLQSLALNSRYAIATEWALKPTTQNWNFATLGNNPIGKRKSNGRPTRRARISHATAL